MSLYNITFSPTGGTKKVADILAREISDTYNDINLCVAPKDIVIPKLTNDDICIIAVPSFGGRVPELNVERIRQIEGNGAKAILVCVYGNREYEDTLAELFDEVSKNGFVCFASVCAIAEHSIARQFASGRPDNDDFKTLKNFAKKIKEKIDNQNFKLHTIIPGNHNTYKERSKSTSKPETNNNCISCGICANACPASAIDFEDPKITNNEKCISCMKCVAVCNTKARLLSVNVLNAISERLSKVCSERKENELFI